MSTRITIAGPNLNTQDEAFHVHDAGCADLRNYGPGRKCGGDRLQPHDTIEADSIDDAVLFVYDNGTIDEMLPSYNYDLDAVAQALRVEFRVFPCVKGLAR